MRFLVKKGDVEYFANNRFLFAKNNKTVFKLAIFDKGYYKLRLHNDVPILEVDGLRMQLVKDFKSPLDYPKAVARHLGIQRQDIVLDTCTGLGYTAIEAARLGKSVITCEISEAVLSLAQWNPWSEQLFEDGKIEIMQGDIYEKILGMKSGTFHAVIHDPPRFSKAGDLYSFGFYSQLHRILKKRGRLFHYVGSVGKGRGRRIHEEVRKRLRKAGFRKIRSFKRLQGLVAEK